MKWYMALLIFCFTFSTLAEARGRSRSRSPSISKRSASASRAPSPKPKPKPRPAPPQRSQSFVAQDKIHSQKVRGNAGNYTPVGEPQKVQYTSNKAFGVKQKTYYRGVKDVNNLPKGEEKSYVDNTFKNGIPSNARIKGPASGVHDPNAPVVTNVWQHQNKSAHNSAFVATTSSKKVAATKYSGPSGGYFEIKPKNSQVIDVNKTVGNSADKAKLKDKEFLFPNEVPRGEIKAWHQVDNGGKVIKTTPNPYYGQ